MQQAMRGVVIFLSAGVSLYAAVAYGFLPLGALVHPDMKAGFIAHAFAIRLHVFAAIAALALGPLQFSASLRSRWPRAHRVSGRIYLGLGVLAGGLSGLYVAQSAFGGAAARVGFSLLALAWLYTGWRAFAAILAGEVSAHREWMTRNFALTFAAVTLRIYLPLAMVAGVPFETAYAAIAWLCWVPNLLAVHLWARRARDTRWRGAAGAA